MLIIVWNFHYLKKVENKMRIFNFFILSLVLLNSCENSGESDTIKSDESKKQELLKKISDFEKKGMNSSEGINQADRDSLISSLNNFYYAFPKDEKTPFCLDKLQMIYSSIEDYKKSSEYLEVIIQNFPKYVNRSLIIEGQASNYDIFIEPRDSAKVRFYYTLLLKENPDIDNEKRNNILKRLEYNHLSFNKYLHFLKEE